MTGEHGSLIRTRLAILFTFNYSKEKKLENKANSKIASYNYCNKKTYRKSCREI